MNKTPQKHFWKNAIVFVNGKQGKITNWAKNKFFIQFSKTSNWVNAGHIVWN
jgi:hypothetical protein|tara:strand:+ start:619 stop:774 length:156 start_codon:yes stop_codon:yes gene_type:complete